MKYFVVTKGPYDDKVVLCVTCDEEKAKKIVAANEGEDPCGYYALTEKYATAFTKPMWYLEIKKATKEITRGPARYKDGAFMEIDGFEASYRYDDDSFGFHVRAKDKEEAIKIAMNFVKRKDIHV